MRYANGCLYVSNRETYPALNKAMQKGEVHIHPHMTAPLEPLLQPLIANVRGTAARRLEPTLGAEFRCCLVSKSTCYCHWRPLHMASSAWPITD